MRKILISVICLTALCGCQDRAEVNDKPTKVRPVNETSSKWISKIIEYRPAPGQFINGSASGTMKSAEGIVGKRGMVSLGAYGGYITFMFDHTVIDQAGFDFVIHGNAQDGGSEAGAVMVAHDSNGNGLADDQWYELRGSETDKAKKNIGITYTRPSQTLSAQDVAWRTTDGKSGALHSAPVASFNPQCYYPLFIAGDPAELSFSGNMLANTAVQNPDTGFWRLESLAWGYVDNYTEDYMTRVGDDRDTERSNKFDLANAIDKDGNAVKIEHVDFIRVYNCLNQEAGWLGETSTEVCGAISLMVKK